MKTDDNTQGKDELRPEYESGDLRNGVRGKHLHHYRQGTNLALFTPDVRAAFPTDESVNAALRALMQSAE